MRYKPVNAEGFVGWPCGFCTPGILISARALLDRNPNPSEGQIREALVGNLCRCTGYLRIIDAVKDAAAAQRALVG
ncbi:MAG TPA: 2Fe-2S iron-sulfur cluster-binding protein [Anaerolineales bacterium]